MNEGQIAVRLTPTEVEVTGQIVVVSYVVKVVIGQANAAPAKANANIE